MKINGSLFNCLSGARLFIKRLLNIFTLKMRLFLLNHYHKVLGIARYNYTPLLPPNYRQSKICQFI